MPFEVFLGILNGVLSWLGRQAINVIRAAAGLAAYQIVRFAALVTDIVVWRARLCGKRTSDNTDEVGCTLCYRLLVIGLLTVPRVVNLKLLSVDEALGCINASYMAPNGV